MKNYLSVIVILNLVLLLGYFNYSVYSKEQTLKNGKLILLKLAPVDPRSLMQGDYMTLNYSISNLVDVSPLGKRGYCILKLDKNNIAYAVRFQKNPDPVHPNEFLIKYSSSDSFRIKLGAESFFFEEGKGDGYEKAKYGGLKIDEVGNSILIGLYNDKLKEIK